MTIKAIKPKTLSKKLAEAHGRLAEANKKLEALNLEIKNNKKLPLKSNLVFGEGPISARFVFIGEAPGANEDKLGRPFVGCSGKLLEKSLVEIGLKRQEVYITNIIKRRPPNNRDPKPREIKAYRSYLERELEIIKPKLVITLGRFALNHFFPDLKISNVQGKVLDYELKSENKKKLAIKILPLFHPSATFRNKKMLEAFKKGFDVIRNF